MSMPRMPKGNNGGFTLVELLVVILIIVILAVGLLPLFAPEITKAQYVREGVPVISNIRTKVELFRIEKNYMPGIPYDNTARKPYSSVQSITPPGSAAVNMDISYSDLSVAAGAAVTLSSAPATAVQWMEQQAAVAGNLVDIFYSGTVALNDIAGASTGFGAVSDHVWKCIDYNFNDLTGVRLRPQHVKYVVIGTAGDSYYWTVGCFGDKSGLKAGCGYAVAEFVDVQSKRKFVATFARYKAFNTTQLAFDLNMAAGTGETYVTDPTLQGFVALPPFDSLMQADANTYSTWIENMKLAGWDVQ